jgi:hypothetical protein
MAAGLAVRLDAANAAFTRGEVGDDNSYTRLVNSLGRCLGSLGISDWLSPPTEPKKPTLNDLLNKKDQPTNG